MEKISALPVWQTDTSLYDQLAWLEWYIWRQKMLKKPGKAARKAAVLQEKINKIIPSRVHKLFTTAIQKFTGALLDGSAYFHPLPPAGLSLQEREEKVRKLVQTAAYTAAAEGGATGAGGIFLGLADFPALLAIKIKMLYTIAAHYGYDAHKPEERLFMLRIFQLAFSAGIYKPANLQALEAWKPQLLPSDPFADFDWKAFQIQYRDFIDLMKLAQLIPLAGAPVGVLANNYLVFTLGQAAMMAYRMRYFEHLDM